VPDESTDMPPHEPEEPSQYEHILPLQNNRQLHYASAGDPTSTTVVLFFAGYFSIGTATPSSIPNALPGSHFIAPTIPGNGQSSSTPRNIPYNINLCESMTALLEELHPSDNSKSNAISQLYIGGGSYGTVPAQMIYGAPYTLSPYGRKIAGLLLAAPFSPFRYHKDYTKSLIWPNWVSVGPPTQWLPFQIVQRLLSTFMASRCKDLEGARSLLDMAIFSKMDDAEKAQLEAWAQRKQGITADEFKTRTAEGALKCTANWGGFLEGPHVLHSDWGFEPAKLDEEHAKPVLVTLSEAEELGQGMGEWLVENYRNAVLKKIQGGHIAALYHWDELWEDLVQRSSITQ